MELRDLNTPSPHHTGKQLDVNSIAQKEDTPFIKETELEEFNLMGGNGGLNMSQTIE
jgi:hypothetical protein